MTRTDLLVMGDGPYIRWPSGATRCPRTCTWVRLDRDFGPFYGFTKGCSSAARIAVAGMLR